VCAVNLARPLRFAVASVGIPCNIMGYCTGRRDNLTSAILIRGSFNAMSLLPPMIVEGGWSCYMGARNVEPMIGVFCLGL
jgi:hypothetical protein